MRIDYNKENDVLLITLKEAKIKESDEIGKGIIADYDYADNIVRLEILYASENIFPLDKIIVNPLKHFELVTA